MQCINCASEINPGGMVCPFCHGNPIIFGSGPYYPSISPPDDVDHATSAGLIGAILLPVFPPVGGALLAGGILYGIWRAFKK
jgi:hypothetical protein